MLLVLVSDIDGEVAVAVEFADASHSNLQTPLLHGDSILSNGGGLGKSEAEGRNTAVVVVVVAAVHIFQPSQETGATQVRAAGPRPACHFCYCD